MPVRAQRMTGIDQVRGVIARGSGGGALTRLKDKQELRVRFIGEPDTWVQYSEHFDKTNGFYPCADDGTCPGCAEGVRSGKKFLVSVIDLAEKTVIALVMPITLAEALLQKYDKFNTLMDRVYELGRSGSGIQDTTYTVDYGEVKKVDTSRFEPLDLIELINTQLPNSDAVASDEAEDIEDAPARPAKRPGKVAKPPADDLDDDVDDDIDDVAPAAPPRKIAKKVAPPAAKAVAAPAPRTAAGGRVAPKKLIRPRS